MPIGLLYNLRAFNRKERFFLVGMALGNPQFMLCEEFRHQVNKTLHVEVPEDAFGTMDYHLDWIYASLFLAFNNANDRVFPNVNGLITATQEDIDFLIAYQDGEKFHLVLLEAKGVMGFSNRQLQSKIQRLRDIFGDDGEKYPKVIPHFAIISPKKPIGICTDGWPSWVLRDGEIPWIEMPIPSGAELKPSPLSVLAQKTPLNGDVKPPLYAYRWLIQRFPVALSPDQGLHYRQNYGIQCSHTRSLLGSIRLGSRCHGSH